MSPTGHLRRSPHLVCYWDGRRFILHNYLSRIRAAADPFVVAVLNFFSKPRHHSEIVQLLPRFSPKSVRKTVERLKALTFLEQISAQTQRRDRMIKVWKEWGMEARFFYWATKDVPYAKNARELARIERRRMAEVREPPLFKHYSSRPQILLPPTRRGDLGQLSAVLGARRTHRVFAQAPLTLADVATLLKLTWGVSAYLDLPEAGRIPLKTSPSGGARHPVEAYVVALRVSGLASGIYHYAADRHRLELLHRGSVASRVEAYCGHQAWAARAAALFVMTAVFERSISRYANSRALRVVLLDAGHLCQTFCLVATALNLAPFCTAALADSLIERDLALDGIRESVLYVAGVGHPLPKRPRRSERLVLL